MSEHALPGDGVRGEGAGPEVDVRALGEGDRLDRPRERGRLGTGMDSDTFRIGPHRVADGTGDTVGQRPSAAAA
ncbi:MAG TPA: hypothetical protein PKY70_15675, partial [Nakamurella multipartita]|nr:hypothetical protein [Nakamurella multipartita]